MSIRFFVLISCRFPGGTLSNFYRRSSHKLFTNFFSFSKKHKKITKIYIFYNRQDLLYTIFLYHSYNNKEIPVRFSSKTKQLEENAISKLQTELFFFTKISVH